jgi:hypothetical protein
MPDAEQSLVQDGGGVIQFPLSQVLGQDMKKYWEIVIRQCEEGRPGFWQIAV